MSENLDAPLWNYAEKVSRIEGGGGNWNIKCKICSKPYKGSYSRVKAHLLLIPKQGVHLCNTVRGDASLLRRLQKESDLADVRKESTSTSVRANAIPLPCGGSGEASGSESIDAKKRRLQETAIGKAWNLKEREILDCKLARTFYASALAFNLARSPYFRDAIEYAASHNLVGYTPPSYNKLRTTALAQERENIEKLLTPIKASWSRTGVSIVSDGWTDVQRRPLINFMAVSQSGGVFLSAVDASGTYKDAGYMGDLFITAIEDVGPNKVVQIVTDNAPVCRAAGLLVEEKYPHIFWTPCVVHTLNLALRNICSPTVPSKPPAPPSNPEIIRIHESCKWIAQIEADAKLIRHFVVNHSMALHIFMNFSALKLLGVAETRFASTLQLLARFQKVRQALQFLVMSDHWKTYREKDVVEKANKIRECILSETWWDNVDYIVELTDPIVNMLRICDTDDPTLHLVYEMWDPTIEKVRAIIFKKEEKLENVDTSEFYDVVENIMFSRWTKNNTPLHCLAHSLNPKYYNDQWLQEGVGRVSPHQDEEISANRELCLDRLFPNVILRQRIRDEFGKFCARMGNFGRHDVMESGYSSDPLAWWAINGSTTTMLQALAAKLLSQPSSSSCCERNWSTYSNIHTLLRNRLSSERAESLVYVHSNLRLLNRQEDDYKVGPSRHWDALGESLNMEGPSALEDAVLSLDEPEFQPFIFDEEDATGED